MPDKYYIDGKGNIRVVPEGKEQKFITKYPGSREATNKELSDFENKRAEMQSSTQRESNIQNGQGSSTAKNPTNQPLNGQNTSFVPNQYDFNIPNYAEEFAKNKPELSLRQPDNTPTKIFSGNSPFARPSKDGVIADAMKKAQDNRRQDTDFIIQSAIDEYESYKKWIDEVNRDPEMSESVKKGLNDWYNHNFRDTNNATDDVRIPSLVKDYLENNKSTVPTSVWVQGSSMFGGGHYAEETKQENTPEQMAMIANFLVNSPKGRMIMEDEKLYLKRLDDNIDELEKDIRETSTKRRELTPKTIRMRDYLRMTKWEKEKFNKEREAIRADIEKQYPFGDLMNSQNQLNELKKLREAYNDGDKGAIKQLLKEFGRRLPYDLANAGSLGTIGLTDQSALSSALENPKNVLTRKGYNLVNEYQQAHELDRSIAQDIARGTTQTLPFITQFVATGGVTSAAGKGLLTGASKIGLNAEKLATIGSGIDKTTRLGKGLSTAGNVSRVVATDVLDAGARSLIMPNTYADAFARSIDNPGSYLDNLTHSWFVNTIENYSEKFGAHLPGIGFKNPKLKKIMDQTGIQGFPEEFAEEQLGTILNAAFNTGEAEWSDLVDPRNQLITAGTIGLLQIPYASVSAGGYAAGKYRDIKQKRSIRKGYNSNLANMNNVFGEESEALISTINQIIESDNSEGVGINSFIANVASDAELTDKEKDAVFKYTMSYVPYSALNQSKQEQVQEVEQQVTQAVEENANPEMGAVVSATIAGVEGPMQIVSGNIVQREDGSIDREASDKQIFYTDAEGNKQVTSIDFVENVEENIPTQDAIAQLTEVETANVISQQENEEVREYTPGEIVTADIYGNGVPFTGQITEVTEAGNYIIVGTQSGQRAEIQPRQIINQDNIQVVDNGSLVQYRNEKGEIVQGTVNDAYGLRPQGMMDIDGNVVPISDVIGLVEEEEQLPPPPANMMIGENGAVPYNPNVSNSQYSTQVTQQNEQSVTTSPSGQNNLSYIEQIPQNESGSLLFEQVPVETTIGALNEVYSDAAELSGVVDATISNIGKQIDKAKSPKPTGDITKDIANKQKANQQIEELNNRLSYWEGVRNAIQQNRPIEQRITEQLTGEPTSNNQQLSVNDNKQSVTNKKPTPFQRRLNAVEENVHTIRDRILFGIASGAYKFRWKDKGVSMGLARELGLSGSEAERKARIGLLSNNGYTPSTLAHRIWEETGGELNDNDIRSEVIDVLNSVSSRKQALETLENNAGITEEQYQQQQTEASEYELQLRAEVEARYNEILSQQIEEDLVSLKDEAVSLGATLEQIEDVRTPSDFIDLIEQLQDGQQEQTSDRPGSNEQTENVEGEGNNDQRTQRAVSERNRSEESTGDSRQDSDSTGNGINLSPEEQRVVNEATAQIDAEIAEAQKELTTQQKELSSARKRLGKAQADTQGNLFGSEQQSKLFNVPADLSKENAVDNILSPIQQQIDAAQTNLDTLTNSRDARIQEALDNYRKQGNLLDEIARAEAETDTSPTEAQKEAGNYKKGKVTIQGFNISIEQPQGSVRSGVDANDKEWSITMNNTYGYIRGTEGKDRDHIDVFLGNNPESNRVFVVDQINQDGSFDEHKVMLGFDSIEEAREAYLSNYEEGWQGLGNITEVDVDTFRKWTDSETRRIKPFGEYKEIKEVGYTPYSFSQEMIDYNREHGANIFPLNDNATVSFEVFEENGKPYVGAAVEGHEIPFKIRDGFESTSEAEDYLINRTEEIDNLWWDMQDILEGIHTPEKQSTTPAFGANNKLVSIEEAKEIERQIREELNNLYAGVNPKLIYLGTRMAVFYIEGGVRKFADFATTMVEKFGEKIKPHLKSMYMGAMLSPGMEQYASQMDSFDTINTFDLDNLSTFEKETTKPNSNETNSDNRSDNSIAEKFDRLVDKLTQTGLAVDVVLNEDIRNNPELKDAEGNVYGYVTPEGVVHLDATRMNANTPIHEFGHLWNSFTKENDTALYNRGIELIKKSPYWVQVAINSDYSYLPEEQAADEAIAMAIGDKGELITNRKLKQQFVDWLSEIWQSIKRAFGINTNVSLADMTLSDFTDRAVQDLLRGERLTDTSVQSKETRMQSVNDLADATNSIMTEEVRNQLDSRIKNFRFRIREAWEDRHLAVKEFIDTLRKNGVEIAEYNDYYKQATHINGKIDAQLEHYNEKFQKPLNKAISDLEKAGFDYRAIENYAILKHGLERNEWMRQDAINQYKTNNPEATQEQIDKYTESLPDDYSGITAVQEEVGMSAEEFITEFENKAGKKLTDNFWKKVKDTTQYSISKQLEGGLIDKKTFDDLTSRYDYYIPLRGHDAEVAEDRWDYSPNMGTYFVAPLIKAKGRKTRSESPFAYIFSMAQSSINSANRNWLNQTMLRLARKDTTGLMGVSQSWYVMDGMNADGVPTYKVESPTFSENPEQYRQNIEEFEERMQKLAEQGFAYPSGSKLDIGGIFIKRNQADQHEVHVWQNGKEFTVYINANPAVARAINGVNTKDLHKDLRFIAKVSRQMAANFTTRNPIFVATNFSRDYIFASSILPVKENAKYGVQFQRNIPRSAGALQRYIRGKADLTKQQDQYVIEYIMNGAKTGFSHIVELDKIQKRIEREIKNGESKNVFRSFLDVLEGCNEFAENLSRLSVYITSREQGRSITQSISDAKEVTVNFNRSGAGGYGAAWFRSLYLFVNAGIQALSNFAKVAQKNKGKTALLISGYAILLISGYAMTGFLMPMLTALVGGDDGLDEYMKLSDWERQNNLCLYTGSGFIKIPLPHELRVFHAMGDNIYQAAFGRKDTTETLLDVTMSFSDLIPANPMGAIQGSWADIMPDATKPFFQLQANRNFTGSRIVNEWADPNKPGYLRVRTNKKGEPYAPAFLVKLGQSLDAATGGDGVEKGLISFNPDEVNHILRGYFGGLYTIGTQVVTIGDKVYELADTGEFKLKVRETPLKTFYTSESDLMTTSSGLNSKYFKISDDMQETRRKIKGYQEQALNGDLTTEEFAAKISKFAPDIEKYKRLYPYMKQIKKYESALKDLDGEDQKEAERIIADMKKQVIEINSIK